MRGLLPRAGRHGSRQFSFAPRRAFLDSRACSLSFVALFCFWQASLFVHSGACYPDMYVDGTHHIARTRFALAPPLHSFARELRSPFRAELVLLVCDAMRCMRALYAGKLNPSNLGGAGCPGFANSVFWFGSEPRFGIVDDVRIWNRKFNPVRGPCVVPLALACLGWLCGTFVVGRALSRCFIAVPPLEVLGSHGIQHLTPTPCSCLFVWWYCVPMQAEVNRIMFGFVFPNNLVISLNMTGESFFAVLRCARVTVASYWAMRCGQWVTCFPEQLCPCGIPFRAGWC